MAKILLTIAVLLLLFGWWGVYTPSGRHRFDEMDGIIPMAALAFGAVTGAVGLFLFLRR